MPEYRKGSASARRRSSAIILALVVVAAVILVAAGSVWMTFYRSDTDVAPGSPVQIEIATGASTIEIAETLSGSGVVANANMFRLQSRLANADGELRAGVYDLTTGMEYDAVIERLRIGPPIAYATVTIPEGFVIEQIAERVETETGIPASEFTTLAKTGASEFPDRPYLADAYEGSLEGFLFPKTYRVKEGSDSRDVIEMMLDQFETEVAQVDLTPAEARGQTLYEIVTIASIIEREAKVAEERELVSSVIYNRLADGMRLQIDATLEYVLPGNTFRLRESDLELDSPYNSYRYSGLPPGPISNPGLDSLRAAVDPADTDYIYYVLTAEDGSHTFAETYAEFEAAKRKSKEVFGR